MRLTLLYWYASHYIKSRALFAKKKGAILCEIKILLYTVTISDGMEPGIVISTRLKIRRGNWWGICECLTALLGPFRNFISRTIEVYYIVWWYLCFVCNWFSMELVFYFASALLNILHHFVLINVKRFSCTDPEKTKATEPKWNHQCESKWIFCGNLFLFSFQI